MFKPIWKAGASGVAFLNRQQRDWKVTMGRACLERFTYQIVFPYISIYLVALGATGTQLGIVNSIGMGVAGLLSLLTGWVIDGIGVKKIYLLGISLLVISYLTYALAWSWVVIIIAMIAYWLGFNMSGHSCSVVCGNSLANEDRATGMSFCETLAAGLLGIIGPLLGAFLVGRFGGVNVNGIRPLFFISLAGAVISFLLVYTQLSNRKWGYQNEEANKFIAGLLELFKHGRALKRMLVITSLTYLPMGMVLPFSQVFAHEVKGADQYILGAMVAGFALSPLLAGIPLGRLADRIGRKKVLYLAAPLFWASNIMLIWAPNHIFLVVAGVLQGFIFINMVLAGAMAFELVPAEYMGRWVGFIRFFRMLLAAGSAFLAGFIWDRLGPQYVFLLVIGLDVFVRIPLLIGMPETLKLKSSRSNIN
jgi:MFS family permease